MARASSPWRRAVIRGDVTTVGVVGVLCGVALGVLAALGLVPPWAVAGALLLVFAGLLIVRVGRTAWRGLLVEAAQAHAAHRAGPTPVPWVHEDVWREGNRFDPELDAPTLLLAEVDPLVRPFGRDADGAFVTVHLRVVTAEERELVAPDGEPSPAEVPDAGVAEALLARLQATPGRRLIVEPRWPVCCGRPAVLMSVRPEARDARARFLPPSPGEVEPEEAAQLGQHAFRCAVCGRRWATDPAW